MKKIKKILVSGFLLIFAWNEGALGTVQYHWAKLEEGDIATPYYHPVYDEDLDRCRAYYQETRLYGAAATDANNVCYMTVPLARPMTNNDGTITITGQATIRGSGLAVSNITAVSKSSINSNMLILSLTTSVSKTANTLYYIGGTAKVIVDGEIY